MSYNLSTIILGSILLISIFNTNETSGEENKIKKIFISTKNAKDWKKLLVSESQWKTGKSARVLAYSWEEANGFPKTVFAVFKKSGYKLFENVELIQAIPEYKVALEGSAWGPSQNDIFVLAKGGKQLISIMVEGKVSENFGKLIAKWRINASEGKKERFKYLLDKLGLIDNKEINKIRYQFIHRTVSAIIEAEKYNAKNALMLVHSFSQTNEHFDDYCQFLSLFGLKAKLNSIISAKKINGINLYFGWIKGDKKYLK